MLGVIEGFYGEPWDPAARCELLPSLGEWGFDCYVYAPKADGCLRRRWREAHPPAAQEMLERLGARARESGVAWGIGLSPVGVVADGTRGTSDLVRRIRDIGNLGADILAVLFDDTKAETPDLARRQASVVARAADTFSGRRVAMCPSYYSSDPLLDELYGPRPDDYLETLGRTLDPAVDVFWTGPLVCSTEYPADHLDRVSGQLRRPPLIWDNYPVNDGPDKCRYLNLRAFRGRGPEIRDRVAGIAVNPMTQCELSRMPLRTLPENLAGGAYEPRGATERACRALYPADLASLLLRDFDLFQAQGLDGIDAAATRRLVEEYATIDHAAALEVTDWLEGRSRVGREIFDSA